MSKKHYIALAAEIKSAYAGIEKIYGGHAAAYNVATGAADRMLDGIVQALINDNPRFDAARFRAACGQK